MCSACIYFTFWLPYIEVILAAWRVLCLNVMCFGLNCMLNFMHDLNFILILSLNLNVILYYL